MLEGSRRPRQAVAAPSSSLAFCDSTAAVHGSGGLGPPPTESDPRKLCPGLCTTVTGASQRARRDGIRGISGIDAACEPFSSVPEGLPLVP